MGRPKRTIFPFRERPLIANSPNPAGQSILASRFGQSGVSLLYLFLGALVPTLIDGAAFMLLR
ncbi:MAG: putative Na+/H+ antiporter [Chthoniobacterales bacterium]